MAFSNQEKQLRFRQKEELKKIAKQIFMDWQFMRHPSNTKSPKEVKIYLDSIIELKSGWTQDDLDNAFKALEAFHVELYCNNPYLLQNDVYAGHACVDNPMTSPHPTLALKKQQNALSKARKLVEHINSAIHLAECENCDSAAAIMEVVREIGVALCGQKNIPRSNATAACLFHTNPVQSKPDWIIEDMAKIIKTQLGENTELLIKYLQELK